MTHSNQIPDAGYDALTASFGLSMVRRASLALRLGAGAALLVVATPALTQTAPDLGAAATYAIVSETFSNSTPGTSVTGDVCFTTGPAADPTITGAEQTPCDAQIGADQNTARAALDAQQCTPIGAAVALDQISIGGGPPGEFPPGCYSSTGAMSITTGATVTLSGDGVYTFRPGGALDPGANSIVATANGACSDNVFWTPTGGTTVGANAAFIGNVFRGTADGLSITLGDSASFEGRALAFGSTVTTANNAITLPAACSAGVSGPVAVPLLSPAAIGLLALLMMAMVVVFPRRFAANRS